MGAPLTDGFICDRLTNSNSFNSESEQITSKRRKGQCNAKAARQTGVKVSAMESDAIRSRKQGMPVTACPEGYTASSQSASQENHRQQYRPGTIRVDPEKSFRRPGAADRYSGGQNGCKVCFETLGDLVGSLFTGVGQHITQSGEVVDRQPTRSQLSRSSEDAG